jgi:hypothetical protein
MSQKMILFILLFVFLGPLLSYEVESAIMLGGTKVVKMNGCADLNETHIRTLGTAHVYSKMC